jgi:hypothetical protein
LINAVSGGQMTLTPGLASAVDLFHKLQRDIGRLDKEVTGDCFFDFAITGYSLIDWVRNDPSLLAAVRSQTEIDRLRSEPWLKVCGDLANASKHFKLTRRNPVVTGATSRTGYGAGRYGMSTYGQGEEDIEVEIDNGTVWAAREFVVGVLQAWLQFFERHKIAI